MGSQRMTQNHRDNLVRQLPTDRRWQLNPPPLDGSGWYDMYMRMHTEADQTALKHLFEAYGSSLLRTDDSLNVYLEDSHSAMQSIRITSSVMLPATGFTFMVTKTMPEYEAFKQWFEKAMLIQIQDDIATNTLYGLIQRKCNTSGQLVRIWPDIVNFLTDGMASSLTSAVRPSRLSNDVTEEKFWLKYVTTWLAQASFLGKESRYANDAAYWVNMDNTAANEIRTAAEFGDDPLGLLKI